MTIKVAVIQRIIPEYRLSLFESLASVHDFDLELFYGDDPAFPTKLKSYRTPSFISATRLHTRFLKILGKVVPWQHGLLRAICQYKPNLILVEGLSHPLGMLTALLYARLFSKNCKVVHWSLGGLPGQGTPSIVKQALFSCLYTLYDHFIVYSSFGGEFIRRYYRIPYFKVSVAFNAAPAESSVPSSSILGLKRDRVRAEYGIRPQKFCILCVGYISESKNTELLIEAVALIGSASDLQVVFLGEGPLENSLKSKASHLFPYGTCIFLGSKDRQSVRRCMRIADLLVVPGRGGMVISEAISNSLPVLVSACDGTELDLVIDNVTGFYFTQGSAISLASQIVNIRNIGSKKRDLIAQNAATRLFSGFTVSHQAASIQAVIKSLT
jgi:glycosyltransferase involved in cell wall biosynthesis